MNKLLSLGFALLISTSAFAGKVEQKKLGNIILVERTFHLDAEDCLKNRVGDNACRVVLLDAVDPNDVLVSSTPIPPGMVSDDIFDHASINALTNGYSVVGSSNEHFAENVKKLFANAPNGELKVIVQTIEKN